MTSEEANPVAITQVVHTIDNVDIDLDNGREMVAKLSTKSLTKDTCSNYLGICKQLLDWIKNFLEGRTHS